MGYSDSSTKNNGEAHREGVVRALISATVFSTLGALIGRWLGKHGNDPKSNMAEPIMKWSMGIFCGLLGAYSSLKTTQRIENERADVQKTLENPMPVVASSVDSHTLVNASQHKGKLVESTRHVALEK